MVKLIDALKVLPCDRNLKIIDYYSEDTLYNGNNLNVPSNIVINATAFGLTFFFNNQYIK